MGSIYQRGDSGFWWMAFKDVTGKRVLRSTETTDRQKALLALRAAERQVAAQKAAGIVEHGPMTLDRYSKQWIAERRANGIRSVGDDGNRLKHVPASVLGLPIEKVTEDDIRDVVREAWRVNGLAPRMVHHIYAALRQIFKAAKRQGLISISPCTLTVADGDLPPKTDKNPAWRSSAIFSRSEAEALISDERIPEWRRVLYGMLFLGGLRINETTPRRWTDYDPAEEPLGRLTVSSHWDSKAKIEIAGTKTGAARAVPVHPALARLLAAWKLSGWAKHQGRRPGPSDLIVPRPEGGVLNSNRTLAILNENDLPLLEARPRRQHDARRTFISLALADGAHKDILCHVTHGAPKGDAFDLYNTPPWPALCAEVAKLRIKVRSATAVATARKKGAK